MTNILIKSFSAVAMASFFYFSVDKNESNLEQESKGSNVLMLAEVPLCPEGSTCKKRQQGQGSGGGWPTRRYS